MDIDKVVPYDVLKRCCVDCLNKVGVPVEHAEITADVLLHANLRGVDSHGLLRLPHYVDEILCGGIQANPNIAIKNTSLVTSIVDGDDGLGHVVANAAIEHAIQTADKQGVGMVGVINSSHCGALSYFVNKAADRGMIGIAMTNTDKMVVPYGGSTPYFGTNPIAFGFPAGNHPSVVLDMATSSVAYGKILKAREDGTRIPDNWGVNRDGQMVTDPHEIVALLPFGGAKGFGLAMVVDIFSGILTGSPFGPHVSPMYGENPGVKRKLGHYMCVIDVAKFVSPHQFAQTMDQLINELHAVKPSPGFTQVMVPGEPECNKEAERRRSSIPISQELYEFLEL